MLSHLSRLCDTFRLKLLDPATSDRLLGVVLIFLMCLMLVLFARHAIAGDTAVRRGPFMGVTFAASVGRQS